MSGANTAPGAAPRPPELELIAELAHDDSGGGHGDRAPQHDRDRQRGAERPGGGTYHHGGEQDLQATDAEHLGLHRDHAREGELEPEGEYQEHHADVRQRADRLVIVEHAERVRPEQHPDDQVAQDRRQRETAHKGEHQQGTRQQDQHLRQEFAAHRSPPRTRADASIPMMTGIPVPALHGARR